MMPRLVSSIVVVACVISASTPASEKRPRLAVPRPCFWSKVASSARSGDEVSPVSAPQPASRKLNSSFEPREKKTFDGIVSTLVGMPLRDRYCATACAIAASLI